MTSQPVQSNDLWLNASKQYALNQKELDQQLLQDSRTIQGKTEVSVISPARVLDAKFEIGYTTIWALFDRPEEFATSAANLFTHLLVPSIGGLDVLNELKDRFTTAPKEAPLALLNLLIDEEETYRLILGRLRQFSKG